jgi:hypothetical protein
MIGACIVADAFHTLNNFTEKRMQANVLEYSVFSCEQSNAFRSTLSKTVELPSCRFELQD